MNNLLRAGMACTLLSLAPGVSPGSEGVPPSMPPAGDGTPQARFVFAVPEFEGVISLGVHDGEGRLVRRLAEAVPENEFPIGLNGLHGAWDGRDDRGNEMPPGEYSVRGFSVGWSEAEGVAFEGNDWVAAHGDELPLVEVQDFAISPDGGLYLLYLRDDGLPALARFSAGWELLWSRPLEDAPATTPWKLGNPSANSALLTRGDELILASAEDGEWQAGGAIGVLPMACAMDGETVVVLTESEQIFLSAIGLREISRSPLPAKFSSAALSHDGRAAAGIAPDGCWLRGEGGEWKKFGGQVFGLRFDSICPMDATKFWAVFGAESDDGGRVGEFSTEEGLLREVRAGTFAGRPLEIRVTPDGKRLLARSRWDGGEQLAALQSREGPDASPGWDFSFDRRIAIPGAEPPDGFLPLPCKIALDASDALGGERRTMDFHLSVRRPDAVEMETPEGLAVLRVLRTGVIVGAWAQPVAASESAPASLHLWVRARGWAEVFSLGDLGKIARIEIGGVSWPPESP